MQQIGKDVTFLKRDVASLKEDVASLKEGQEELRMEMNLRFDNHLEAVQAIVKAVRGMRVEQYNDRQEIRKIKSELASLKH